MILSGTGIRFEADKPQSDFLGGGGFTSLDEPYYFSSWTDSVFRVHIAPDNTQPSGWVHISSFQRGLHLLANSTDVCLLVFVDNFGGPNYLGISASKASMGWSSSGCWIGAEASQNAEGYYDYSLTSSSNGVNWSKVKTVSITDDIDEEYPSRYSVEFGSLYGPNPFIASPTIWSKNTDYSDVRMIDNVVLDIGDSSLDTDITAIGYVGAVRGWEVQVRIDGDWVFATELKNPTPLSLMEEAGRTDPYSFYSNSAVSIMAGESNEYNGRGSLIIDTYDTSEAPGFTVENKNVSRFYVNRSDNEVQNVFMDFTPSSDDIYYKCSRHVNVYNNVYLYNIGSTYYPVSHYWDNLDPYFWGLGQMEKMNFRWSRIGSNLFRLRLSLNWNSAPSVVGKEDEANLEFFAQPRLLSYFDVDFSNPSSYSLLSGTVLSDYLDDTKNAVFSLFNDTEMGWYIEHSEGSTFARSNIWEDGRDKYYLVSNLNTGGTVQSGDFSISHQSVSGDIIFHEESEFYGYGGYGPSYILNPGGGSGVVTVDFQYPNWRPLWDNDLGAYAPGPWPETGFGWFKVNVGCSSEDKFYSTGNWSGHQLLHEHIWYFHPTTILPGELDPLDNQYWKIGYI